MKLWDKEMPHALQGEDFEPYLTPYPCPGAKTAIIVCPGGAYHNRATYEGDDVAAWLNSIGIAAYVLEYRVMPYQAPAQPSDVQRAVRLVRKAAQEIAHIGIMGFSAGGHLAATASVHYDKQFYAPSDEADTLSARPDFSVLCYSVLDMMGDTHLWTKSALLGENPSEEDLIFHSPYLQVTEQTPPAFVWHTAEDAAVPASHALRYAGALVRHSVPVELHVFPFGGHGSSLAQEDAYVGRWKKMLEAWLKMMRFL